MAIFAFATPQGTKTSDAGNTPKPFGPVRGREWVMARTWQWSITIAFKTATSTSEHPKRTPWVDPCSYVSICPVILCSRCPHKLCRRSKFLGDSRFGTGIRAIRITQLYALDEEFDGSRLYPSYRKHVNRRNLPPNLIQRSLNEILGQASDRGSHPGNTILDERANAISLCMWIHL
jgi:hypothetical protein